MSYFSAEEPTLLGSLGCGPGCNCGPCQSGMSGFNQWYESDDDVEPPFEVRTPGPPPNSVRPTASAAQLSGRNWFGAAFGYYGQDESVPVTEPVPTLEPEQPASEQRPTPSESRTTVETVQTEVEPGPAERKPPSAGESRENADVRLIHEALSRGIRNAKRITDIVFFARHPDRSGSATWASDPGLFDEWREIREQIVLPELRRSMRPRPRPRIIVRARRMRRPGFHGYPGLGLGYFGAPPVCDAARRDLAAIADDLRLINNELVKGPGASAVRLTLKRKLLDLDVDGMIHSLDSYISSGCCEPSLKTLESEIQGLSWPILVIPTKARLISQIFAAQDRARKDFNHC